MNLKSIILSVVLLSSMDVSAAIGIEPLGSFNDSITGLKFGAEKVFLSIKYNLFEGAGDMRQKLPESIQGIFELKIGVFEFSFIDEIKAMLNGIVTGSTNNEFIAPILNNPTVQAIINNNVVKTMANGLLTLIDKLENIGSELVLFIKAGVLLLKDIKDNVANGAQAVLTAIMNKLPDLMILLQRYFSTAMENASNAFKNMTGKFAEVVNRIEVPNFFDNDGTKLPLLDFFKRMITEFSDIMNYKLAQLKDNLGKYEIFKRFMTIVWMVKNKLDEGFGELVAIVQQGQEKINEFKAILPDQLQEKFGESFRALKDASSIENVSEKARAQWQAKLKLFPIVAGYVKFDIDGKRFSIAQTVSEKIDAFKDKVTDFSKYQDLADIILGKFNLSLESLTEVASENIPDVMG